MQAKHGKVELGGGRHSPSPPPFSGSKNSFKLHVGGCIKHSHSLYIRYIINKEEVPAYPESAKDARTVSHKQHSNRAMENQGSNRAMENQGSKRVNTNP